MADSKSEKLKQVEQLIREAKLEQALDIVINYEKKSSLTDKESLSVYILKGRILSYTSLRKAYEIGDIAYLQSKKLNDKVNSVEALLLKLSLISALKMDVVLNFVIEAENLLNSSTIDLALDYNRLRAGIKYVKALIKNFKGEYNRAEELAFECLEIREKLGYKLDITQTFYLLSLIYSMKSDLDLALDYALKCLSLQKDLGYQYGIPMGLYSVGYAYTIKGDYEKAFNYFNLSLSSENLRVSVKIFIFIHLGGIYREKGELDQSIKTFSSAIRLAEEKRYNAPLALGKMFMATVFRLKGEYSRAQEYLEHSLTLSQKAKSFVAVMWSLFWLTIVNIEKDSIDQAEKYLNLLKNLDDQTDSTLFTHVHYFAKANLEKKKGKVHNRFEAKKFLKDIIRDKMSYINIHIRSLVLLCELLLEELNKSNDPKVLEEINTLIEQSSLIAEKEHSDLWLTEIKLLQAKLALIQINIPDAKRFLTQAQHTAELNDLTLLAQKISSEHDRLLEQLQMWEHFKKINAPMSDRMELAAIDGDIDLVQGKLAVNPPELVNEVPILLLIMDNNGATYFNHPFVANWDHSDLFSSFLSAFNTFSDEIFSKSIDRIRIGENTILINPVESFLTCYVIKGQSYPALQKLNRFTEAIKGNSEIWQALNKSAKTSEMLELDKPPALKTVINKIFT